MLCCGVLDVLCVGLLHFAVSDPSAPSLPPPDNTPHIIQQVLSNPELRAKYDKYGAAALDVEFADPSMIFGMLFGSELFEPIVGEFLIAAATSKGRELTEKEINHMQVCVCV